MVRALCFCLTPGHDAHGLLLALNSGMLGGEVLGIELSELHERLTTCCTIHAAPKSLLFKGKDNTMHLWHLESKKFLVSDIFQKMSKHPL